METKINDFTGGVGNPERFRLSEYDVAWLDSGEYDEQGSAIGGFVSIRVARTGLDDEDWFTSDETATTRDAAFEMARGLIAEWEIRQQQERYDAEDINEMTQAQFDELLANYSGGGIDKLRAERARLIIEVRSLMAKLQRTEVDLETCEYELKIELLDARRTAEAIAVVTIGGKRK